MLGVGGGLTFPVFAGSFLGVGSLLLLLSEDKDSTDDWLDEHDEVLLSSTAFFGGGPLDLFVFLRFVPSFWLESSVSAVVNGEVVVSFSSLDLRETLLGLGDPLGLLDDLLSDSDSELLSGEKMLFFLEVEEVSDFAVLAGVLAPVFGVLAPPEALGVALPLARTLAADFGFAEQRLRGGKAFGLAALGASSSLEDEILAFDDLLGFGSSFFFGSSTGAGFVGDFGGSAGALVVAGVSEVDDSESELVDPDPELVEELTLLLESDEDPELLSVLLLLLT